MEHFYKVLHRHKNRTYWDTPGLLVALNTKTKWLQFQKNHIHVVRKVGVWFFAHIVSGAPVQCVLYCVALHAVYKDTLFIM